MRPQTGGKLVQIIHVWAAKSKSRWKPYELTKPEGKRGRSCL
jgi:hypothetical protein